MLAAQINDAYLTMIAVAILAAASTAGAIVGCVGYHVLSRIIGGDRAE